MSISGCQKLCNECASELHASKRHGWRSPKHAEQWLATIEQHAKSLRDLPVAQIDTSAVLAVLQPIWRRFPETSSRLRGRIEAVLDYAKARGLRTGENPAAWRGHLALILPKHGTAPRHHAAMPYGDVPAFVTCLHMSGSISSRAMEFAILTTARPGEVLGARWTETDPDKKVWTVPASRMKGGREHRVPLSGRAAAILVDLAKGRTGEFIFPGQHPNKHVSSRTLEMLLRRMKVDATPHGFRSSFRDWAAEATGQSALIHILRSGYPLSHELREGLASALEPIGNSLLQLKKRLRRKPGRPSKTDEIKDACRHAYEVHDIGPKIEHPRAKPPQAAAGTKQKKPLLQS